MVRPWSAGVRRDVAGSTQLSLDLYKVARAAEWVEQGQAGAAIPALARSREARPLSSALQRMTQRLLSANEDMEGQAHQRTQEPEVANRELDQLVRRDPLTGVLNRRGFRPNARWCWARANVASARSAC